MARYVDGFVIPIPKKSIEAYRKISAKAGKIWMEYGALQYVECVGEHFDIPGMSITFPKLAKTKPNETVVFSWIVYKSRAHRDRVNAKVMADPRLANMAPSTMPFDIKRMAYGGFETIVDMTAKK
ncbi:MAG: DUF1428 domain-containing protein [Pirellulales bacterium]|nr:DUF1428 domain-containing protein [Pirellulales bacterium]